MLSKSKVKISIQSKVIYITKTLMQENNWTDVEAMSYFLGTELFKLLNARKYELYISPVSYVLEALEVERTKGVKALYKFLDWTI